MSKKDTGGPAFARSGFCDPVEGLHSDPQDGMTLRDYFAAKAIQALAREISEQAQVCQVECNSTFEAALDATIGEYVRRAYKIADAMLKAREK